MHFTFRTTHCFTVLIFPLCVFAVLGNATCLRKDCHWTRVVCKGNDHILGSTSGGILHQVVNYSVLFGPQCTVVRGLGMIS